MVYVDRLRQVREAVAECGREVAVVAAVKMQTKETVRELMCLAPDLILGENRVQELTAKYDPAYRWHFIGQLQTNKVKYLAPFVSLIHSVDSMKLAETIDKEAAKAGRMIDVLLQLHIAQEETKFGWDAAELEHFLQNEELSALKHIRIRGLMGMASLTDDTAQVSGEFRTLHNVFITFREKYLPHMDVLSMGMSGDYPLAIAEGATMVRIGSSIFGARQY